MIGSVTTYEQTVEIWDASGVTEVSEASREPKIFVQLTPGQG